MFQGLLPLLALTALCFQLPGLTRTPMSLQTPPHVPSAANDNLEARLLAVEAACSIDHVVRVRHHFATNGQFCWNVDFSQDALMKRFDLNGYQPSLPPGDRLLAWYREVAEQLVNTLKTCASGFSNGAVSVDWDIPLFFANGDLDDLLLMSVAEFRGRSLIRSDLPNADSDPLTADADGARFEAKVVPASPRFKERDSIVGEVIWRNVGNRAAHLHAIDFCQPRLRTLDGETPPSFESQIYLCSLARGAYIAVDVAPGETYRSSFSIATDPFSSFGGYLPSPGRYEVHLGDAARFLKCPVQVEPGEIEILEMSAPPLRAVRWFPVRERIVVVFENGDVVSAPMFGDAQIYRSRIERFNRDWNILSSLKCSPTGEFLAVSRFDNDRYFTGTELLDLRTGEVRPVQFLRHAPGIHAWGVPDSFTDDGSRLIVFSERCGFMRFDVRTGEFESAIDAPVRSQLAPDGETVVLEDYPNPNNPQMGVVARVRCERAGKKLPPVRAFEVAAFPVGFAAIPGRAGLFIKLYGAGEQYLKCVGYDGADLCDFPPGYHLQAQSPNGRFVALSDSDPSFDDSAGELSIWELGGVKPLWSIESDRSFAAKFDSTGSYVVSTDTVSPWLSLDILIAPQFCVRNARTGDVVSIVSVR